MDSVGRLRRLAINDACVAADPNGLATGALDAKALALARLAALVAVDGAVPSFGTLTQEALSTEVTAAEIVDLLIGLLPIVGIPCVVAAAPKLALALGYDTDGIEPQFTK